MSELTAERLAEIRDMLRINWRLDAQAANDLLSALTAAIARAEAAETAVAEWMLRRGFATGHGDTVADMLAELSWQFKEREDKRESAERALREATEPRAMDSAPRDKHILGLVDGKVRTIRYGKTSHVPMYGFCLADQGAEDFDLCKPSCWWPLPPPPAQEERTR